MGQAPFFSIIIPTYNRAAILPRAIQSVLDQIFTDWELIIVDDGSTDETEEAIAKKNITFNATAYSFLEVKKWSIWKR